MAESIVINLEELFIRVSGRRITALPAEGQVASLERSTPRAEAVAGLHDTIVFSVMRSKLFTLTINVLPQTADDAFLRRAADTIDATSRVLTANVRYQASVWASVACVIANDPVRNFQTTPEALGYQLIGNFGLAKPVEWVAPAALDEDTILATA